MTADLPLPDDAITAADQVRALIHLAIVRSRVLSLQVKRSTAPQTLAAEIEQSLAPLLAEARAQVAAAERERILAIADQHNVRAGWYVAVNDRQTSGLRTLRDLLDAADSDADTPGRPAHPRIPGTSPQSRTVTHSTQEGTP